MSGAKVAALAVAAYAALVLSLATVPPGGRLDWTPVVPLAVAHLGLGWAVARAWVLLLPVALCVGTFVAAGASDLDWLVLFLGLPVLVAVTAVGLLLGRRTDRRQPRRDRTPRAGTGLRRLDGLPVGGAWPARAGLRAARAADGDQPRQPLPGRVDAR